MSQLFRLHIQVCGKAQELLHDLNEKLKTNVPYYYTGIQLFYLMLASLGGCGYSIQRAAFRTRPLRA